MLPHIFISGHAFWTVIPLTQKAHPREDESAVAQAKNNLFLRSFIERERFLKWISHSFVNLNIPEDNHC